MRLINADTVVHWQTYDDEHETFPEYTGTIAEFLDSMTDEGCPESVDTLPSALQEAIQRIETKVDEVYGFPKTEYAEGYVNACKAVIKMLKSLSSVDAVEVVRCRDCKHYQFSDNRAFGFPVKRCEWTGFEDVDDGDFCSRGERKDGDDAEGTV